MTRRTSSMVVATVTLVLLVLVAMWAELPYVVVSPGLSENTLGDYEGQPVVSISGHKTYPVSGNLDLTTVSVSRPDYYPRLPQVMSAWWSKDDVVSPREQYYPSGQTVEEAEQRSQAQMLDSQSQAIIAGLERAGFDAVDVTVTGVASGMPAGGHLRKDDIIKTIDGKDISVSSELSSIVGSEPAGTDFVFGVERDAKMIDVRLATVATEDSTPKVGINLTDVFDPPFDVSIDTGRQIGGPSAGLMFSLAIYDLLTPGPMTGGMHIAGTGTIDASGLVGSIGGIQQKLVAAHDAGATVFLSPADNCADALESRFADDFELIRVATMDDAVQGIEGLADGDTSDVPHCGD